MTFAELDNWVCFHPVDFHNLLDACKRQTPVPKVNSCIASPDDQTFHCASGRLPFANTENYVCMSPQDTNALLKYCKSLKI